MSGVQEMVHCPYNFAHVILKSRMAAHLIKCRQQFPTEKFESCPFNSTHDVPAPELQYHIGICPDRKQLENYIYVIDEPKPDDLSSVQVEIPPSSENWDEEESCGSSFLNVKDKIIEKQLVFRQPVGKSKAERKAFFHSEVQRFGETSVEQSTKGETSVKNPPKSEPKSETK